jgi:hypothetical protein
MRQHSSRHTLIFENWKFRVYRVFILIANSKHINYFKLLKIFLQPTIDLHLKQGFYRSLSGTWESEDAAKLKQQPNAICQSNLKA